MKKSLVEEGGGGVNATFRAWCQAFEMQSLLYPTGTKASKNGLFFQALVPRASVLL